jgi:predicted  nucleic acid-binding Zn-ribbon protein
MIFIFLKIKTMKTMKELDEEIQYWSNKLATERNNLIELNTKVEVSQKNIHTLQDFIASLKALKSKLQKNDD